MSYLKYGWNNWRNIWQEILSEDTGQIDVHHDVAIADIGTDVGTIGRLNDVWHQRVQFFYTKTADNLTQTLPHQNTALPCYK